MPSASQSQLSVSSQPSPSRVPPPLPNELLLLAEQQWLFTESELLHTPTALAGLDPTKERENRGKGVNFILQVGIMLKLPQITLATASIFLHRFFMRNRMEIKEFKEFPKPYYHYYTVAGTCLFLATKVEENCRKMKELVVACVKVAQKNPSKVVDEQDKEYWRWKDNILQLEDILLEAICFDLSVDPPYKTLFDFLVYFGEEENKKLRNTAWAFINDSCLTMLCLLFSSRAIAASALYAAAKHCGVRFRDDENGRPWWEVVGIELRDIRRACNYMAGVYENSPLRKGTDGAIYERTPEDGDELFAKTRQRRDDPGASLGSQDMERAESTVSNAGSDVSAKKRKREDEGETSAESTNGAQGDRGSGASQEPVDDIPWGGDYGGTSEEREGKRLKPDVNGTHKAPADQKSDQTHTNGTITASAEPVKEEEEEDKGLQSPNLDDISEEGEVEP